MRYPNHLLAEVTALLQSAEQAAANAQTQLLAASGPAHPPQLNQKQQKQQQQQVHLLAGAFGMFHDSKSWWTRMINAAVSDAGLQT